MTTPTATQGWPRASVADFISRRLRGANEVDDWGLDPDLVDLVDPLLDLRWNIEVRGADALPAVGGAVLVFNRRFGFSEAWILARGVRQAGGRYVRTVGAPDGGPVGSVTGPFLRRFGAVLDRTDEIAGLLLAGQLVGLPVGRALRTRREIGGLDVARLEAALATGSPIVPAAVEGSELGRNWKVAIGTPIPAPVEAGPLAAVELAEVTRQAVERLVDDTLAPRRWP